MKKSLLYFLTAVFALTFFSSCKKDVSLVCKVKSITKRTPSDTSVIVLEYNSANQMVKYTEGAGYYIYTYSGNQIVAESYISGVLSSTATFILNQSGNAVHIYTINSSAVKDTIDVTYNSDGQMSIFDKHGESATSFHLNYYYQDGNPVSAVGEIGGGPAVYSFEYYADKPNTSNLSPIFPFYINFFGKASVNLLKQMRTSSPSYSLYSSSYVIDENGYVAEQTTIDYTGYITTSIYEYECY